MLAAIDHYYQQPWVVFFKKSSLILVVETLILLGVGYFYPYHSKTFYDYYDYWSLIQTYYLIWLIIRQTLSYRLVPDNIKLTLIRLLIGLGVALIYKGLHLIWTLYYLDVVVTVGLLITIIVYHDPLSRTLIYIYSNLTLPMKKSLLLYVVVLVLNQVIYSVL